jgi:RNA recognition motif-containing protein
MLKLFVGNLPATTNEVKVTELFSSFGTVRSIKLVMDVFSGNCKGFGFVEMEGHEARAAMAGLNGRDFCGQPIRVSLEDAKGKRGRR